eukprot:CAMPEP_0203891238 /NCGR_PEP_ID=MMETSP0359-20131031/34559_1 /ASSEMBLY_ACC=CAM_ASM_000338 /TAXON_ID=268821 /ORGANISM="Scrippsiella Hangoei, Strain SHTV-5" /LENGTH=71 /DNA_ID=CAMNT_0050812987 /DNA_START=209 /DNA_END=424 /DNA_ORIENTATION=-
MSTASTAVDRRRCLHFSCKNPSIAEWGNATFPEATSSTLCMSFFMKEAGSSKKSVTSSSPLRPNKCFAAGE